MRLTHQTTYRTLIFIILTIIISAGFSGCVGRHAVQRKIDKYADKVAQIVARFEKATTIQEMGNNINTREYENDIMEARRKIQVLEDKIEEAIEKLPPEHQERLTQYYLKKFDETVRQLREEYPETVYALELE
ncbi:hypothetical protein K8I28_04145 [bacterium]|nr:hypothetical protein [bacterium]